jgi:hypothetical protein
MVTARGGDNQRIYESQGRGAPTPEARKPLSPYRGDRPDGSDNENSGRESESVRYVEESSGRGVERQLAERKDGRSFTDSMNRIYMGIDVGKKSHHATVLGCTGQVEEQFQFANTRRGFDGMVSRIQVYQGRGFRVLVGMDATGCYWYSLYSFLSRHLGGESVKVVDPLQLGRYRKLLIRKPHNQHTQRRDRK